MSALDMEAFFATIIASVFFVFSIRLLFRNHVEIFWRLEFILRLRVSRVGLMMSFSVVSVKKHGALWCCWHYTVDMYTEKGCA